MTDLVIASKLRESESRVASREVGTVIVGRAASLEDMQDSLP